VIALTCSARSTLAEARAATLGGLARVNPLLERVHLRGGPSAIARHPMQTWSHSRTARLVIAAVGIFLRYQCRSLAWRLLRRRLADTVLCSGASYSVCINAGYTDHGYHAHSGASYRGADTGHNYTNCVADVETVNGVARPSYHLGDAWQLMLPGALSGVSAVGRR
jgi:hypothetical protein